MNLIKEIYNNWKRDRKELFKGIVIGLILLFVLFIYTSIAHATCTDLNNATSYYSFDTDATDSEGLWDGTVSGATNIPAKLSNGYSFDGVNDYISNQDNTIFDSNANPLSITLWIYKRKNVPYGMVYDKLKVTAGIVGWSISFNASGRGLVFAFYDATGKDLQCIPNDDIALNTWQHWVITYDGNRADCTHVKYYKDGTLVTTNTNGDNNPTSNDISNTLTGYFGQRGDGATHYWLNATLDEVGFYPFVLNSAQVTKLYNSGSGCNPYSVASDTTPPTITFSTQRPADLTSTNVMGSKLYINYTITDSSGINNNKVNLTYFLNQTLTYYNGTKINIGTKKKILDRNISNMYQWSIDDNQVYGGTYNLNESYMENTAHLTYNLSATNNYIKMEFINITPNNQYNFYELMSINGTFTSANAEYFFCNSSYTSGNPTTNQYCTLFFSESSTSPFNHTHTIYSKHRVIPLAFKNNKLNGVGLSRKIYILKRGSTQSEITYYVSKVSRTTAMQLTSNSGNTWTNFAGTFDAHIHQMNGSSSINYKACASDNFNNTVCSVYRADLIQLSGLAPTSVKINNPLENQVYYTTDLMIINYTTAISPNNYNITRYIIQYNRNGTSVYNNITLNNYPALTYTWDLSSITPDYYYKVKIIAYDQFNLSSYAISGTFLITSPPSTTDLLLISINSTLHNMDATITTINNNIDGGFNMITWLILFLVFMYIGLFSTYKVILILDSFVLLVFGFIMRSKEFAYNQSLYNNVVVVLTFAGFILIMWYGITQTIQQYFSKKDKVHHDYRDVYPK